ncbi:MAG: hypothetical protein U5K79_02010 [Cyclobacteriaceae bacterium]|nr:hypothetical protein [Cyclobacteriaceae bacterium]
MLWHMQAWPMHTLFKPGGDGNLNPEGYEKVKASALKALELDNSLAEASATLGSVICNQDWEWEESRKILKHAIQLNPNYATAQQYYAELTR